MMGFVGRVNTGATWYRILRWKPPHHGYLGKLPPKVSERLLEKSPNLLPGERLERMTAEKVVQGWIRSLKQEGRPYEVIDDGEWITVRSLDSLHSAHC